MNGTWKDLLAFNRRERNGIVILTILIFITLLIQLAIPWFAPKAENPNPTEDKVLLSLIKEDSILRAEEREKRYSQKRKGNSYREVNENNFGSKKGKTKQIWNPVTFNPNTADFNTWKNFGLSPKQIKTIEKYLATGAEFKIKQDVKKLFVINDELFDKMESFILLPDSLPQKKIKSSKINLETDSIKKPIINLDTLWIELNSTDTIELKKLRGIGSYYARQIIWYRDKLGGFQSINQLYEIERMRPETVEKIKPFVWVDSSLVTKFKINSSTAPQMVKHPYITWNMAVSIQDYREFTKKFKSTHQLVDLGLLNEEIYSKLAPYLEL